MAFADFGCAHHKSQRLSPKSFGNRANFGYNPWLAFTSEGSTIQKKIVASKTKYTFPRGDLNPLEKRNINIHCGDCFENMEQKY